MVNKLEFRSTGWDSGLEAEIFAQVQEGGGEERMDVSVHPCVLIVKSLKGIK